MLTIGASSLAACRYCVLASADSNQPAISKCIFLPVSTAVLCKAKNMGTGDALVKLLNLPAVRNKMSSSSTWSFVRRSARPGLSLVSGILTNG